MPFEACYQDSSLKQRQMIIRAHFPAEVFLMLLSITWSKHVRGAQLDPQFACLGRIFKLCKIESISGLSGTNHSARIHAAKVSPQWYIIYLL
jgi:hypothetical protein